MESEKKIKKALNELRNEAPVELDDNLKRKLSEVTLGDIDEPYSRGKWCSIPYSTGSGSNAGGPLTNTDPNKLLPFFKQNGIECSTIECQDGIQSYSDHILFHGFTDRALLLDTIKNLPGIKENNTLKI